MRWSTFISLLSRRPPNSPLFPYTTLFRSLLLPRNPAILASLALAFVVLAGLVLLLLTGHRRGGLERLLDLLQDRKSTRLNSSHLGISYAVFCLKKKKCKYTEANC